MIRTFFLPTLCIIFCLVAAFPSESDNQNEKDQFTSVTIQSLFPLSNNISWRYERTSREGVSHYSTKYIGTYKNDKQNLHIISNPFGASYYASTPDSLSIQGIAPAEDVKDVSFYEGGDIIRLQTPLRRGIRWKGRVLMEKEKDIIVTAYDTEILGWEKISVPAGNFDTLVTSSTQHTVFLNKESGQGKGVFTFEQVWYGLETGIVRRDIHLLYPGDVTLPLRDDKLEELIRD